MSVFDVALGFGKTDHQGHGTISDKYEIKKGIAPEIAKIRATHGSHSAHSSSK